MIQHPTGARTEPGGRVCTARTHAVEARNDHFVLSANSHFAQKVSLGRVRWVGFKFGRFRHGQELEEIHIRVEYHPVGALRLNAHHSPLGTGVDLKWSHSPLEH